VLRPAPPVALNVGVVADRHPPLANLSSSGGSVAELIERAAARVDPQGELAWFSPTAGTGGSFEAADRPLSVELIGVPPADHAAYYLEVGAGRIWPVLHDLPISLPREAATDPSWRAYVRVNDAVARSVAAAAPPGALVTVHDYSVLLAVPTLRALRPDIRLGYVHHTPWPHRRAVADGSALRLLHRLCRAVASADVVFVSAERWSVNLASFARGTLGPVRVVHPGVDTETLRLRSAGPGEGRWAALLDAGAFERPIVAAVGRADPAKNFDTLVRAWTELVAQDQRGTLCVHHVPTTRATVGIYAQYRLAVDRAVADANRHRPGSIVLMEGQDKEDALRLLRNADVVAACSRADGWNLVAVEAAALGPDHQQLVLSSGIGAVELLGPAGWVVQDPSSPAALAETLRRAIAEAVRPRDRRVRPAIPTPEDWWGAILSALKEVARP
jgi:trehalose 6-phosphate synthase